MPSSDDVAVRVAAERLLAVIWTAGELETEDEKVAFNDLAQALGYSWRMR